MPFSAARPALAAPRPATGRRFRGMVAPFLIVCLAALVRGWLMPSLGVPVDEGAYLSSAKLMNDGAAMYTEIITNKPPGIYLLLAAAFRIFGEQLLVARALVLLAGAVTTMLLYAVGSRLGSPWYGGVAALFFALDPFAVFWGRYAMTDPFLILFTLLAVWLALVGLSRPRRSWFVLAGLAVGLAALMKQVGVLAVVPVAALALLDAAPWRVRLRRAAAVGGGALLVMAVLLLWLVAVSLPLGEFFEQVVGVNFRTNVRAESFSSVLASRLDALSDVYFGTRFLAPFLALAPAVFFAPSLRGRWRRLLPIWIWLGSELVYPLTARNFGTGFSGYSHYHLAFLPSLALIAGLGGEVVRAAVRDRSWSMLAAIVLLSTLWARHGAGPAWGDVRRALIAPAYPGTTLAEEREVAGKLRALADGGAVYSYPHPGLYFWSGLPPASPFLEPTMLYRLGMRERFLQETVAMLSEGRARVLVTARRTDDERLPEERALIETNYKIVWPTGVEDFTTYEGFRLHVFRR